MTERKLSISLYIFAFIITVIIFLTGIYVGTEMSKSINAKVLEEVKSVSQSTLSLELILLMDPSEDFCPVYTEDLQKLHEKVTLLGDKLTYIEDVKNDFDPELKKEYFNLELSSYLLRNKVKELCGADNPVILYFYSNENCDEPCKAQGKELDAVRASDKNIILYTFDGTLDSTIVKALKDKFDITKYPSLVINGETFSGLQTKEKILNIVNK